MRHRPPASGPVLRGGRVPPPVPLYRRPRVVAGALVAVAVVVAVLGPFGSPLSVVSASRPSASAGFDGYPAWVGAHHSMTRKHLSRELYARLRHARTRNGFSLDNVIQAAVDLPQAANVTIGCVAGDEESYTVFAPLLDAVIAEYHHVPPTFRHVSNWDVDRLTVPDFPDDYVLSTRIRVARSVAGLPFPAAANRQQRRHVERLAASAVLALSGDLAGKYFPVIHMADADKQRLIAQHFLFEDPDAYMMAGGLARDWPDARGLFTNQRGDVLVWVNEEDHLRIMTMRNHAQADALLRQLHQVLTAVAEQLQAAGHSFARDARRGYLTSCPTNIGTGMRASMMVRLPLMGAQPWFKDYVATLGLQARGQRGERDHTCTGVFDVSNRYRLGQSEVGLVQHVVDGVAQLIQDEQVLEAGGRIEFEEVEATAVEEEAQPQAHQP